MITEAILTMLDVLKIGSSENLAAQRLSGLRRQSAQRHRPRWLIAWQPCCFGYYVRRPRVCLKINELAHGMPVEEAFAALIRAADK